MDEKSSYKCSGCEVIFDYNDLVPMYERVVCPKCNTVVDDDDEINIEIIFY